MEILSGPEALISQPARAEAGMKIRPGVELGNLTDVGCHRSHNEDYYCYAEPKDEEEFRRKGRLMVIADGMGGHRGGEVASALAIEVVRSAYLASEAESPETALVAALQAAHLAIRDLPREHPELQGLGTTCIAAALRGCELTYAHVGDSRLYLVRNSAIAQLTQDHTVTNRLLQQGALTPQEAAIHPDRGVLLAALGGSDRVAVEVPETPIALQTADILLMSTDGLHDLVEDQELAAVATANPPAAACRALVELAKSRGGFDNITVQILKVEGTTWLKGESDDW
jgi:protein phosphatase